MNDVTIPAWAVALLSVIVPANVLWLIFLTKMTFKNKQDIAVNTANDQNVSTELIKINSNISEMKLQSERAFDKLEKRIDALFGTEMAFLKNVAMNNLKGGQ